MGASIIEVYPKATLWVRLGEGASLRGYKGRGEAAFTRRRALLARLQEGVGPRLAHVAEDVGDRDGDGLVETLLTTPDSETFEGAWAGVLPGAELPWGAPSAAASLDLQAVPQRRDTFLGQRARLVGDVDGDGADDVAVGGHGADQGAVNAGAVALLPVPR